MTLHKGKVAEYKKRHTPIWEELKELLKSHEVHNYSIFFDEETHTLFGYAEIKSEEKWNAITSTEICKKWWDFMADIMETNPDNNHVSKELKSNFYLK
jgi:L-rhamnose mutarotase